MDIDYNSRNAIDIVSSMIDLIENRGFNPDEVMVFIDKIKEESYDELVEIYNKQR